MYLTSSTVNTRLRSRYGIASAVRDGDLEAASAAFDALAPFTPDVALALDGDPTGGALPDALKDWISLTAHQLAAGSPGPVRRDSMQPFSTEFATPELNSFEKRCRQLIGPYLRRTGVRA